MDSNISRFGGSTPGRLLLFIWAISLSLLSGCSQTGENETANEPDSAPDVDGDVAPVVSTRVWESWPKPAVAFMLTADMHGYFEPCGCTSNQLGGMSRRADLLAKMTGAGWTVRGLDVGGLARRSALQAQIKFETTLAALRQLNYAAIGLGPEELRLDPDFIWTQHITEGDSPLYFLSANLTFYDSPDLGTPLPYTIVEAGGLKIGVTSVLSRELQAEVLPHPVVTWKDPIPALKTVMEEFSRQQVDFRVLLSQARPEESEELAKEFPDLDVVVTAEGPGDPDPKAPPTKVGDTLVIEPGRKGKYVGVLGLYPDNSDTPFRYQLVSLERNDFDETQAMIDLMQEYQTKLKDEQVVLKDGISVPHPSGATYVGADRCGECHTSAFAKWKDSAHAHALESLDPANKRLGHERLNGIQRTFDPECLACHVTGWDPQEYIRYRSGYLNPEYASTDEEKTLHTLLAGNQCESCHGPGSLHIELVEADKTDQARALVRVTKEESEKTQCGKCHDADNSPKFDFDSYWEKIAHPGLD